MDLHYHINLVKKHISGTSGYKDKPDDVYIRNRAFALYPTVEQAQIDVVNDGDYLKYVNTISTYDQFYYDYSRRGDQTNIFAYPKIKIGPSWLEQIWAPVFERVRVEMQKHWEVANLVTLQNTQVIEYLPSSNQPATKDVDGGIGIQFDLNGKSYILPIVVAEVKGGHFCKTMTTQVDGIFKRFKSMNSNLLCFAITDNKCSIGKDVQVESAWASGGVIIVQRGKNGVKEDYPKLNVENFYKVEELCIRYLKSKSLKDFINVSPKKTSGIYLRSKLNEGSYIPNELQDYLDN